MGLIKKIIDGLSKTKQAIGFKLKQLFKVGVFGDDFFDELEEVLLTGDVGAVTTEEIIQRLKDELANRHTTDADKAYVILKEILIDILGDEDFEISAPHIILVVGVNGVGKTTTIGKLSNLFASNKYSVTVAAADTFRAAAADQLEVWTKRANVKLIRHNEGADAAAVVFDAINSAKSKNTDVLIIDTAGRLHNKVNLMEELKKINRIIDREYPQATRTNLIVLDATCGQNALSQVKIFDEAIEIDGIVLTKLDGTAKGGVVLAISCELEKPVYFVGVGEKLDDLIKFDSQSFVQGLLETD